MNPEEKLQEEIEKLNNSPHPEVNYQSQVKILQLTLQIEKAKNASLEAIEVKSLREQVSKQQRKLFWLEVFGAIALVVGFWFQNQAIHEQKVAIQDQRTQFKKSMTVAQQQTRITQKQTKLSQKQLEDQQKQFRATEKPKLIAYLYETKPDPRNKNQAVPKHSRLVRSVALDSYLKLLRQEGRAKVDLAGAQLSRTSSLGCVLIGASLQGANLEGANLAGADLRYANLEGANLKEADLIGANLIRANLRRANLTGADLTATDFELANLEKANLTETLLEDAILYGANLSGANLTSADLGQTDLRRADLKGADLTGATFDMTDLDSECDTKTIISSAFVKNLSKLERLTMGLSRSCRDAYEHSTKK